MERFFLASREWWIGAAAWCVAVALVLGALVLLSFMFLAVLIVLPVAALVLWLYYRKYYHVRRETVVFRSITPITPEEKEAYKKAVGEDNSL